MNAELKARNTRLHRYDRPQVQYSTYPGTKPTQRPYRSHKRRQVTDYSGDVLVLLLLCMMVGLVVLNYGQK